MEEKPSRPGTLGSDHLEFGVVLIWVMDRARGLKIAPWQGRLAHAGQNSLVPAALCSALGAVQLMRARVSLEEADTLYCSKDSIAMTFTACFDA